MTLIDALIGQLEFCEYATRVNVGGISHEESLLRPQAGGNCANWILGHITSIRYGLLIKMGEDLARDARMKQYRRGSAGDVAEPVTFQELVTLYDRLQKLLMARLQKLTESDLAAKSPIETPAGPDATLGSALAFLLFHESYHVGQLGVARRLLGKPGAIA